MFNHYLQKIRRKIFLKRLYSTDRAIWRVEVARDKGVTVGDNCRFYSADFFSEPYLVEIGSNVIISGRVIFMTHDGAIFLFKDKKSFGGSFGPIKVGNNCFIGMGAIIFKNVTIGDNCVIGAGSVVRKDVADNSVVLGNPAEVLFKTPMLERLLDSDINTIPTPFSDNNHKREILTQHFGLNPFNGD